MTETRSGQRTRASYSVSAAATHLLPRKGACDGRKGERIDGAKKEEYLTAESTWKYKSMANKKEHNSFYGWSQILLLAAAAVAWV